MSKKTLNEAVIRRFMGLAGLEPAVVSNYMKEGMYEAEEEEELPDEGEEGPPLDDMGGEEPPVDDMGGEEEPMPEPEAEMPEPDAEGEGLDGVDITPEQAQAIIDLGDMLKGQMPAGDEEEMPMGGEELPPEGEEELPPEGEEEELLEKALAETDVELSEEEVVKEVARRVATRILKAKKAKAALAEALGTNKRRK